jgi:predicted alpha/beta superfamily hydrolase
VSDATVYEFDSLCVGDRLAITVSAPLSTATAATEPVPTLYVLDPVPLLGTVEGTARTLAMWSSGRFPPTVIVGVGYPSPDPPDIISRRRRDLTPTEVPLPPTVPEPAAHGRGKAAAFLRSLREEVIPGIEARYRVHPTDRTLIGWSLGGLFGLYALFHQPESFARYLLVSPSIWWGDTISFDYEQRWAERHTDLEAKVFLAAGEREQLPGRHWPPEMVSEEMWRRAQVITNLHEMEARLVGRSYPSLTLECVVFADEHHPTVVPAAVSRGLMSLFVPPEERFAVPTTRAGG